MQAYVSWFREYHDVEDSPLTEKLHVRGFLNTISIVGILLWGEVAF